MMALAGAASFASGALAQSPYEGMTPVAGDDHRHPGSLALNYEIHRYLSGLSGSCSPHSTGDPLEVYGAYRDASYDWVLLSHHTFTMTGDPHGGGASPAGYGAYEWWTNPASTPIARPSPQPPLAVPDPDGLPDYTDPGNAVVPGWNEALSFSTAADAADDPEEGFVAFAGREFTPAPTEATGAGSNEGGHKVVLLPGTTDRICGPETTQTQGAWNACDETDLYRWVRDEEGVIIQAHPGGWGSGMTPWHPTTARAGMTDVFVHGVEVSSLNNGLIWELAYQRALGNGYRVFPSYGSDHHHYAGVVTDGPCGGNAAPSLATGAVMCWVPNDGLSRGSILDAMRARNCYYSRSHKSTLTFEARDDAPDDPLPMGSEVAEDDGTLLVSVYAVNDLANQAVSRRFDRLEIVQVSSTTPTVNIRYACDLTGTGGANGGSTDCCTLDGTLGDRCTLTDQALSVGDGALYARVCQADGGSSCPSGSSSRLVGAPVFVNWPAYKAAQSLPTSTTCDFDSDSIPCWEDLCWNEASSNDDEDGDGVGDECDICPEDPDPAQADADEDGYGDACQPSDADGDGFGDAVDICVASYDTTQVDSDSDGYGNACDNCDFTSNADQADGDSDGVGDVCDVCPGDADPDQADGDGDGVGDECDNCVSVANADQADYDADGSGDACDSDDDNDGYADTSDNCEFLANPDQLDVSPSNGVGDACDVDGDAYATWEDNCPTVANASQADSESNFGTPNPDGVGDACDNCVKIFNSRIDAGDLTLYRSMTGWQRDDDADGYGNACDGDFDDDGDIDGDDVDEFDDSVPDGGPYPDPSANDCGTGNTLPCDQFDMVENTGAIDQNDHAWFNGYLLNFEVFDPPVLEKCADCGVDFDKLPCVGDACIACNDGVDNDGDSDIDYPADSDCTSASDIEESPDNDGVADQLDNCLSVANASPQNCDTDQDGYGNMCDADFDNNWAVVATDFPYFTTDFGTGVDSGVGTDHDCNGSVVATDFGIFTPLFKSGKVGPSGLACAGTVPCDL